MTVNSWGISPRVASVVAEVWYQSHTIISVSPVRVLQLCFKKLFCSEIKLAIIAALESGQNTSGAINCGTLPHVTSLSLITVEPSWCQIPTIYPYYNQSISKLHSIPYIVLVKKIIPQALRIV